MANWPTFSEMRSDPTRTWHRRSDIIAAAAAEGIVMTWHDAKKALKGMQVPQRKYGHYRYTDEHRDAVLRYGRSMMPEAVK